jgi:hypothetical protein
MKNTGLGMGYVMSKIRPPLEKSKHQTNVTSVPVTRSLQTFGT